MTWIGGPGHLATIAEELDVTVKSVESEASHGEWRELPTSTTASSTKPPGTSASDSRRSASRGSGLYE